MTEYTSNRLLRFPLLGVLLLCATMLPGCAAQETTRTGFLSHYQAMERDDKNKDSLVYKAPHQMTHTRFMIDEVAYIPGPKSDKDVTPEQLADIKQAYRDAAIKSFSERYTYTDHADIDVMRVRLAITGIDKANAPLNYATLALIGPVSNGGASSESGVFNALTGEPIAALATHTNANPINGGILEYFTKTGHAKSVLADHARQLRQATDAAQPLLAH